MLLENIEISRFIVINPLKIMTKIALRKGRARRRQSVKIYT